MDSWLSPVVPVTGIIPPENTNCDMIATTSSGMICSLDLANADSARPTIAAATHVAAMSTNNSNVGFPSATAPRLGEPLAATAIAIAIADCSTANTVKTQTLANRYA